MPQMHERERLVSAARAGLLKKVMEWQDSPEYEVLTDLEAVMVAQSVLSSEVDSYMKYALRYERHGNFESPAGLA